MFRLQEMSKLSSEEQEILEAFDKGKLKRSKKAADTQLIHKSGIKSTRRPCLKKMRV